MTFNHFEPTLFTRHKRPLHTLWLEGQAWFCIPDLARLMGRHSDDHMVRKLDPDQHRVVRMLRYGQYADARVICESGAYALLAYHYIPENRRLRHWLTHEVIAALRARHGDGHADAPQVDRLEMGGRTLAMLQWQSEPWIRLRDLPKVLVAEPVELSWKQAAARLLKL